MPNTFQEIIDELNARYQANPDDWKPAVSSAPLMSRLDAMETALRNALELLREKFDQDYRSER